MINQSSKPHRRGSWAWLLAVPPAMALIGGAVTLYFVVKYPDQAIVVSSNAEVPDEHGVHQHVVNSVTPPLK
ncbi:MAG: hypothetical protein ABUL58_03370 [Steroidobacter sp.]